MDLTFLSGLSNEKGPYASVYLDTSRTTEDAIARVPLEWRAARERLRISGADEATLSALDAALKTDRPPVGVGGHALIARAGQVVLDEVLPAQPRSKVVRYSPLPHLMPLLLQSRTVAPHVVVICDRRGADIVVVEPGEARAPVPAHFTVAGDEYPITKVAAGGWSQRRFQQRAENTWDHNAKLVAQALSDIVTEMPTALVVLAGDERARAAVLDALEPAMRRGVTTISQGSRAPGSDQDAMWAKVRTIVADRAHHEDSLAWERFEQGRPRGMAADGIDAVLSAFQAAAVDTLYVLDSAELDQPVAIGPEPIHLARTGSELIAMGVPDVMTDRLDAAVVRAAAGTGADLVVLDSSFDTVPRDGIAALCRHS